MTGQPIVIASNSYHHLGCVPPDVQGVVEYANSARNFNSCRVCDAIFLIGPYVPTTQECIHFL